MSLTIPTGLSAHLMSDLKTLAICILINRLDGQIFAFTDHDRDLTFDSVLYKSKGGFSASAIEQQNSLAVDNLDIEAAIDDDNITDEDLKRGLFNGASAEVFLVNYMDLTEKIVLKKGTLGDVVVKDDGEYFSEIRGLTAKLQNRIGSVYLPTCNARQLGDSRCKLNLSGFSFVTTVAAVTSNQVFTHSTSVQADGFFTFGLVEWLTGSANEGFKQEVKLYNVDASIGTFTLQLPMLKNIQVGDSFRAIAGCDRKFETCKNTFNNAVNFRGFPNLPGLDQMLKTGN